MAKKIWVIGVGPGARDDLTARARDEIERAERVYAAKRHAHLVSQQRFRSLEPLGAALENIRRDFAADRGIAVLVSGDPGLYSMLPMLENALGRENLGVIPGISALQALSARLGETWQNARVLSVHARPLSVSALLTEVRAHESLILFCDAQRNPAWIAGALTRAGLPEVELAVGERLDYADERITRGPAREIAARSFDPLSMVRVRNPRPQPAEMEIGLSDEAFIRGKTPMTKKEIRVLALAALKLRRDAVVWDIGAGTGSVSVECARQCPYGRVLAIERDGDALELIARNAEQFKLPNLEIIPGSAPGVLRRLPAPTHVFLGGTGGDMAAILRAIEETGGAVRLAATAVTLESAQGLAEQTRAWKNVEMAQVGVSRLETAGAYHLFRAQNPVFLLSADWEGAKK